MVLPKAHRGYIHELTKTEWDEMHRLSRKCVDILQKSMPIDGFNIGMNLGAAAGAGIRDHIHNHIVPRFIGDGNFMAVTSDTHIQSFAMLEIYDLLKPHFDKLRGKF